MIGYRASRILRWRLHGRPRSKCILDTPLTAGETPNSESLIRLRTMPRVKLSPEDLGRLSPGHTIYVEEPFEGYFDSSPYFTVEKVERTINGPRVYTESGTLIDESWFDSPDDIYLEK